MADLQSHEFTAAEFLHHARNNPVVQLFATGRLSARDTILTLSKNYEDLQKLYRKALAIAPFKLRVGETEFIWRCPDELVPAMTVDEFRLHQDQVYGTAHQPASDEHAPERRCDA